MHDNSGYGFDPHDDSDFLTIHDNEVYDNGYHGIIASKRCNGVSIQVRLVWLRHARWTTVGIEKYLVDRRDQNVVTISLQANVQPKITCAPT